MPQSWPMTTPSVEGSPKGLGFADGPYCTSKRRPNDAGKLSNKRNYCGGLNNSQCQFKVYLRFPRYTISIHRIWDHDIGCLFRFLHYLGVSLNREPQNGTTNFWKPYLNIIQRLEDAKLRTRNPQAKNLDALYPEDTYANYETLVLPIPKPQHDIE